MTEDVQTKNMAAADFARHNSSFVSDDIYWSHEGQSVGD